MTAPRNLYDALIRLDDRLLTPTDKELLEDFIKQAKEKSDYFNKNSKILRKSHPLLDLAPQKSFIVTKESIEQFFQLVRRGELEKGNPEPVIDSEIWESILLNVELQDEESIKMQLYSFLRQSISYHDLLKEGKKQGVGKIYSCLGALVIARQVVLEGFADGVSGTVIFYKIDKSPVYSTGTMFCLCLQRPFPNKQLFIKMKLYNASKKKPGLNQVCFS